MIKAEKRALEKYPANKTVFDKYEKQRYAFICGYIQAEKDLELSWEDMEKIVDLYDDVYCDFSIDGEGGKINTEEHYQEVLKRFKGLKHVK